MSLPVLSLRDLRTIAFGLREGANHALDDDRHETASDYYHLAARCFAAAGKYDFAAHDEQRARDALAAARLARLQAAEDNAEEDI